MLVRLTKKVSQDPISTSPTLLMLLKQRMLCPVQSSIPLCQCSTSFYTNQPATPAVSQHVSLKEFPELSSLH